MNKFKWFRASKIILSILIALSIIVNCALYLLYGQGDMAEYKSYFVTSVAVTFSLLVARIIVAKSKRRILCSYLTKQLMAKFKQDGAKRFCLNCAVDEDHRKIRFCVIVSGDVSSLRDEEYNEYLQKCSEELIWYIKKPVICSLDFGEWSIVNSKY